MAKSGWSVFGVIAGLALCLPSLAAATAAEDPESCDREVRSIPLAQIKITCAAADDALTDVAVPDQTQCKIAFAGVVRGSPRFKAIYYQLANYGHLDTVSVLFTAGRRGRLKSIACDRHPAAAYNEKDQLPRVLSTKYGAMLELPAIADGDAGVFGQRLYLWRDHRWRSIDLHSYRKEFLRRIRPRFYGAYGSFIEIPQMRSTTSLYADGDAHAAPSGFARMHFTIRNDKLILTELRIEGPSPRKDSSRFGSHLPSTPK